MKILSNTRDNWPKEKACSKCASSLEVSVDDVEYAEWKISGYHFDGSAKCEWRYSWDCPVCATHNWLNQEEFSSEDGAKIRTRHR